MHFKSLALVAFLSLTNGQFIEEVSIVSKSKAAPIPVYNHQAAPSTNYQNRSPGHLGRLASNRKNSLKDPLLETCFNRTENDPLEAVGSQGSKEYSRTLIRGSHAFSLALTKFLVNFESKDTSKGILVSPFSVWSSLIVMYMGSKGRTEVEIRNALEMEKIPKESVAMAYQGLRLWYKVKANSNGSNNGNLNVRRNLEEAANSGNKFAEFSVANRVFINSNLKLSKCIQNNFLTEVQSVDFADSSRTLKSINSWISRMTHGRIVDLISPDSINAFTQLLIANAVYFKSPWESKFDPNLSFTGPFTVSPTETTNVTYMKQTSNFMFANSEDLSVSIIDLPYIGSAYSMLIVLPDSTRGIDNLISTIKPDDIYNLVTSMYSDEIELTLPKFKLEQEFDLAGPLYSLGVKSLFDPRIADLSGFLDQSDTSSSSNATSSSASEMLSVNNVVHKASIAVDEEGSEAAAATAFLLSRSGRPLFPTKFTADRPFMYLIRDTATNVILFSGIVRRPSYE